MMETLAMLVNADKLRVEYTEYELSAEVGREVKRGGEVSFRADKVIQQLQSSKIFHDSVRMPVIFFF